MAETKRQKLNCLIAQMEAEQQSYLPHWRDLSDYILPRRSRFLASNRTKGQKVNQKIIDSTATDAADTLRSGMLTGTASPAREWFRLTVPDPDMAENPAVKAWLHEVQRRMYTVLSRSNLYDTLPLIYGDMGVFGTGALLALEDEKRIVHFYAQPIGSYCIACDEHQRVNTISRKYQMTVRQIVGMFCTVNGMANEKLIDEKCSRVVIDAWKGGRYEQWVDVTHIIHPNAEYKRGAIGPAGKKIESCYYETSGGDEEKYLREAGFDEFPAMCPRWDITGEDVYGSSPGMKCLGDVKSLQTYEKRMAQAVEKQVNPPMTGPTSLQNPSILPGEVTYVDTTTGQQGFRPAHEVNLSIKDAEYKAEQCRQRIRRSFYADLFLMLTTSDRREITAREIEERHEEKMLMLGPVVERTNNELLAPIIDRTFSLMLGRRDASGDPLIPPAPEELQGVELKVEFVSMMAQAQKAIAAAGIERLMAFAGRMAEGGALDVADNINTDEAVTQYADILGTAPTLLRSKEEVAQIRQQRAQAQQAAAQMQAAQVAADSAHKLAGADMSTDNALVRLVGREAA